MKCVDIKIEIISLISFRLKSAKYLYEYCSFATKCFVCAFELSNSMSLERISNILLILQFGPQNPELNRKYIHLSTINAFICHS